ncbi:hypothetical protein [Nonomuraea sp. NPDC050643]|uniref:hypothetical protein n=1 Tax=Nonomuraea sp. NPDC050643 TaxID=3155660 RepID=UPI00340E4DC3
MYDSPTTPFRKIVLPAEETIRISRPPTPGPSSPVKPPAKAAAQQPAQAPAQPPAQSPAKAPTKATAKPPTQKPDQKPDQKPAQAPGQKPAQGASPAPAQTPAQAPGQTPAQPQGRQPGQAQGQAQGQTPGQTQGQAQGQTPGQTQGQTPGQAPGRAPVPPPYRPVWPPGPPPQGGGPNAGQQSFGQPSQPLMPLPSKPPARGLGDIPIKVVYLLGAILATVLAVVLIFVVFSGDVPSRQAANEDVVRVAPVPTTAAPTPSVTPTATESAIVLPPVPSSKAYARLSGTASVVTGIISDRTVGISYPRLAAPWKARSFSPFSIAQRIGKVAVPNTVIASAMYPGESPEKKPSSNADYRDLATQAARWAIRTQYPAGAKLDAWTASKKIPVGKGWTLGYKVTYTVAGKEIEAQAMVTVVEVGKTKPAMLLASIPEGNKQRWRDLNTLAEQVRPL